MLKDLLKSLLPAFISGAAAVAALLIIATLWLSLLPAKAYNPNPKLLVCVFDTIWTCSPGERTSEAELDAAQLWRNL